MAAQDELMFLGTIRHLTERTPESSIHFMTIDELLEKVRAQAKEKGFGLTPDEVSIPEKIALIHSEISEAYKAYRHKNIKGKDGFEEELGDAIQRILHLCVAYGIDIEQVILKKMEHNKDRTWDWDKMNEGHAKK